MQLDGGFMAPVGIFKCVQFHLHILMDYMMQITTEFKLWCGHWSSTLVLFEF